MPVANTPGLDHEADAVAAEVTDDLFDLTDRRRVLVAVLFGVDVAPEAVDHVFAFDD